MATGDPEGTHRRKSRSWQGPGLSVQEEFLQPSLFKIERARGNFQKVGGVGLEKRPKKTGGERHPGTTKIHCLYLPGKLAGEELGVF